MKPTEIKRRPGDTRSIHAVNCEHYGLDPDKTSQKHVECLRFGLDPETASIQDLIDAGSNMFRGSFR